MEFRILGPLDILDEEGASLPLGGLKQRALLAILLLHANEVVSSEQLIDELWGDEPPETAAHTVRVYVSRLRKTLSREAFVTKAGGYALQVRPGEFDLARFEELSERGRDELAAGDAAAAARTLGEGLGLWRGRALAEFGGEPFARVEADRLEELRLAALMDRIEADLATSEPERLVAELEVLVAMHPFRERLRGQLMLALYRSGRQADALSSYQEARRRLVDELGLEPSQALQQLERAILAQAASLERLVEVAVAQAPTAAVPRPSSSREPAGHRARAWPLFAAGIAVALAGAGAFVMLLREDAPEFRVPADSLTAIDLRSKEVAWTVLVGARPASVVAGDDTVWVANLDDNSVSRIDPRGKRRLRTIGGDASPSGLALGFGALWVANSDASSVSRIDPRFDRISETIVFTGPEAKGVSAVAVGLGAVWVAHPGGAVSRIDPGTNGIVATILVGNGPSALAVGAGAVWVANRFDGTVSRIDPSNAVVATIPTGRGPAALAVGAGSVWVANGLDDTVSRIDPATNGVGRTIGVGRRPAALAVGEDVWVANSADGTLSRIDADSGEVESILTVGKSPVGLAATDGRLLLATQQAPASLPAATSSRGDGILRVNLENGFDSTDPARAYSLSSWQLLHATCVKLLNYPDRTFPAGSRLVPEAAESLPRVSDDGKTYSFTIREGFRFSPPSTERVTAQTFKEAIERSLSPKLPDPLGAIFLSDVVGATAYVEGRAAAVSGIAARGDTLTIRLTKRSFDLPARLAMPFFCAVPRGTPLDPAGIREIPSAGPYFIASETPGRQLVLEPNPGYAGGRPQRLARIVYTIGVEKRRGVSAIEAGRADYAADSVPPDVRERLRSRYGARAVTGRRDKPQYFRNPVLSTAFLVLNTRRRLFADARLRRAVAYAVDRPALLEQPPGFPGVGEPTDQLLPSGMPGFRDLDIYPLAGPELATAGRLAAGQGGRAVLYTCNVSPCPEQAATVASNLGAIGIQVEIRQFPFRALYTRLSRPGEPWDIAPSSWAADYADPSNFLNNLLERARIGPGGANLAGFSNASFDRRLRAAAALTGAERYRAYARLDVEIARKAAPLIPIATATTDDFFSARVGCHVYHPVYGMDLAALCLRR